jgi:hypothetical protein
MKGLRRLTLPPRERLRNLRSEDTRWVRGGVQHGVGRDPHPVDEWGGVINTRLTCWCPDTQSCCSSGGYEHYGPTG